MKITKTQVQHIAFLSYLELSEAELDDFSKELSSIVAYIEILNTISTEGISPTYHVFSIANVYREDEVRSSLPREQLLRSVPDHDTKSIRVPKIIETSE